MFLKMNKSDSSSSCYSAVKISAWPCPKMYLSLLSGLSSLWGACSIIHRKPKCPVYPPCRHPRTRLWSASLFIWYWTFITPQSQLAPALTTRPGCSRLGSDSQTPGKSFRSPGLEIIGDQSSKNAKRKQRTSAMISMGQLHETESGRRLETNQAAMHFCQLCSWVVLKPV